MRVELAFDDLPDDIEGAIADMHVEDQSEADAPAPRLFSGRAGPFTIRRSQPTIVAEVDLSVPEATQGLALIVRVRGRTRGGQPVEFLTTTTTALPADPRKPVRAVLSRIS
jgi:hypothetical protein